MNLKYRDLAKNYINIFISLFSKSIRIKRKVKSELIKILPEVNAIDIGASYFPHSKWSVFIKSKLTCWFAVDPNIYNLSYIDNWHWPSKINKFGKAISAKSGKEKLFITNTDSGSSLLKPVSNRKIYHRFNENYFFPYEETEIEVLSLNDLLKNTPDSFYILKLDTQGSEFNILKNLDKKFWKKILSVELESNLNYEASYENSSIVNEVFEFFRNNSFELIDIDVVRSQEKLTNKNLNSKFIPNEADLVFAINSASIIEKGLDGSKIMLGVYECYGLYEEMYFLSNEILNTFKLDIKTEDSLKKIIEILN